MAVDSASGLSADCRHESLASEHTALLAGSRPAYTNGEDRTAATPLFLSDLCGEFVALVKLSIPIICTSLLGYSVHAVTIFSVGHISTSALAAAGLGILTFNVIGYTAVTGFSSALDTLCTQAVASKPEMTPVYAVRALLIIWLMAIPQAFLFWNIGPLFRFLRQEEVVIELAVQYLRRIFFGLPAFGLWEVFRKWHQSHNRATIPTFIFGIAALFNLVLNYLLVLREGPLRLGFIGAPTATCITYNFMAVLAILHCAIAKPPHLKGAWTTEVFRGWGPVLRLGGFSFITISSEFWGFEVINLAASWLGPASFAAQSITTTVSTILYHPLLGASWATGVRVGNLIGAGDHRQAKIASKAALLLSFCQAAINILILLAFRARIGKFFSSDAEVVQLVSQVLPFVALCEIADAPTCVSGGILRGLGIPQVGALVNILAYWVVGIPLGLALAFGPLHLALPGLWLGLGGALLLGMMSLVVYVNRLDYRRVASIVREMNGNSDDVVTSPAAVSSLVPYVRASKCGQPHYGLRVAKGWDRSPDLGSRFLMSIPRLSVPSQLLALQALIRAEQEDAGKPKLSGKVWRPVLVITGWSAVVATADLAYGQHWHLSNNVIPLLSVVVGLMLVFRNTTAYGRWDEGRKSFTALVTHSRSLSRHFWVSIGARVPQTRVNSQGRTVPHVQHDSNEGEEIPEDEQQRKVRALRLLVAFVVATKRHVRGEYGCEYEDLRALLPAGFYLEGDTPGFGYGSADADAQQAAGSPGEVASEPVAMSAPNGGPDPGGISPDTVSKATPPATSPRRRHVLRRLLLTQQEEVDENQPLLSPASPPPSPRPPSKLSVRHDEHVVVVHNYMSRPSLPLPLIIAHQLQLYLAHCKAHGLLESVGPAGYNTMCQTLAAMTDQFTHIEKLALFTMPSCYSIHMKQCTTLYLIALPLTLLEMQWKLIPFVTVCAFTLMGIEALARECENPFGDDPADLPLDMVSAELRNEVEHLIARLPSSTSELLF